MAESRTNWLRTSGSILLLVGAAYLVYRVRGVIVTVLLALVTTYLLRPTVDQLSRLGVRLGGRSLHLPRPLATGLVYVLLGVALWAIFVISADSLRLQVADFQVRWPTYRASLAREAARFEDYRQSLPPSLQDTVDAWTAGLPDLATNWLKSGFGATARGVGMLIELILVPILAFYFLADGPNLRQQVLFFVPRRHLAWTSHALTRSDTAFQRFIRGQVILCLIAFGVVTAGLRAIHLDFYLLLGLIAGITRAIPVIGPVVGAIPIIIVLLVAKPLSVSLWVVAGFTLLHVLESKFLMPAVLGRQLRLHPALIIVSLLVGAQVAGLLGMFLAAPVLAVIRTLVEDRRQEAEQAEAATAPVPG